MAISNLVTSISFRGVCSFLPQLCQETRVLKQFWITELLFRLKLGYHPGLIFLVPCIDAVAIFDVRTQLLNVPSQEILTNDGVSVDVDAVVYYKVRRPMLVVCKVQNHLTSVRLLAGGPN